MASREKRPLAPSKSKQKANNDSGLPSNEVRNKKGKTLSNVKDQQVARSILEAVATGSQLPPKLEASLPRKKVLRNLKRKQKLRVAKANLIKSKVTRKVSSRNLCRINTDIKKNGKAKRIKLAGEDTVKTIDANSKAVENHINNADGDSTGAETTNKSAKNNLRTKKTKSVSKSTGELESEDIEDTDNTTGPSAKVSPKLNKKGKSVDNPDSLSKGAKPAKFPGFRRNNIKEREGYRKGRRSNNKEADPCTKASGIDTKLSKSILDSKNSIDLTIDEVIASMLSDSEIDHSQSTTEKIEGKVTRSKKMLVDENIILDIEIKKEPESDDTKNNEGDCAEPEQGVHYQNAIQLRKRTNISNSQRSLRNGKLRQLSDSGISTDLDFKRHKRLNSDDPVNSENPTEHVSDSNVDTESCFSESSGNEHTQMTVAAKDESCPIKEDASKNLEEMGLIGLELENNNNSDRIDRATEVGPTLRSKTKAKSTESDTKNDETKVEYQQPKSAEVHQDELKKSASLDQVRKDSIIAKLTDKSKSRRSSLNIDMKKTVSSFYGTETSDGSPKSQIDQMIENIKLTIAKSIESKIFGPEKGLGLNKNFEVPKIEEVIAPLSAESQKLGLDENTEEEKSSAVTKNEIKSENSENSVPKVADTAKEIEKLVMGDIELAETHSQNVQESEPPSDIDGANHAHNISEAARTVENNDQADRKTTEQQPLNGDDVCAGPTSEEKPDAGDTCETPVKDEGKKVVTIRKSPRISDKSSTDSSTSPESLKKASKVTNKTASKSENTEESATEKLKGFTEEEPSKCELSKGEPEKDLACKPLENDEETKLKTASENQEILDSQKNGTSDEKSTSADTACSEEELETLESISEEVEKLVAEVHAGNPEEEEEVSADRTSEPETEAGLKDEEESPRKLEEAATCSDQPDESVDPSSTDKGSDAEQAITSECTKKNKNSSNISTTGCNSISEHNTVNSVSHNDTSSNSLEEVKKNGGDKIKDDKCKEVNTRNDVSASGVCFVANENEVPPGKNSEHNDSTAIDDENEKSLNEKNTDEQRSVGEDNRRVLRARDRSRKNEKRQTSLSRERTDPTTKIKTEEENAQRTQNDAEEAQGCSSEEKADATQQQSLEEDDVQNGTESDAANDLERQARTRRSRDAKKRKEEQQLISTPKSKRPKREMKRSDQQTKEETLLDNEVAKINENDRSFLGKYGNGAECMENFRGFSENGRTATEKLVSNTDPVRSKSESDLMTANEPIDGNTETRLSRNLSEDHVPKQTDNVELSEGELKPVKTPEASQKDSDEASTSGESSSGVNVTPKILETPEDKAKKESILRLLGLETLEKAAERLSHQRARKEQYTGTLKTVIRVQKEKEKDKRRSRSPLKMVLKQGRGDGEGDSPEFYTIQKEFGTSGLGDSSSGANRKFTTNHRHSCDEDNEDAVPKDRQSLVIPEKSSSFSIHPERLCADVCCYCFGKFGSLDTPMHLAQMKSDERRKKILNVERHLTKDSCLCDACYRHVDRKANTSPTNMQTKPQKQHRQLMVSKCSARECRDPARHHVKRRWLLKIKPGLQNQVDIDWESSQHTSMSFCVSHYAKIERFLTCALCKRRLARNHTHQLANTETDELNQLLGQQGIPVVLAAGTFVCKLCRYFTQLQLKYKDVENMNANHRSFSKSYRKRILHYHHIEVLENEEEDSSQNQSKDKDKRKKANKCAQSQKSGSSKSPDGALNSASEKSTPEPNKNEGANSETDNENRTTKIAVNEEGVATDVQYLGIESAVEKLKKRKLLDMHSYPSSDTTISCDGSTEVVEILAMDKEVTLTRLPKKPRTNNDITPVVQRLGANPSISVRTLFPGEEEMNLHANIEFSNVREITPQGWEKCATMIQYDRDTKLLWQELQRPYGNQSSFLRHLILLEKYYRSGDLVLAPNASRNAINYSTSVQNRLISYEGPEKMDEPIMEPITSEYNNPHRLSGGYVLERDKLSIPSTSSSKSLINVAQHSVKGSPPRVLKLNPGVSIIKKPPPNLQRLSLPSTSTSNGNVKRKDGPKLPISSGGKVFQLSEPDFKRLQTLKRQKQLLSEKQSVSPGSGGSGSSGNSPPSFKSATQYQKAQIAAHTQFQKHLRMQQEMLNRQSRSDFEPLICDVRSLANENSPTQNLLHNLNLPKSIQVTTKPSNPIPILPKIPKSLTVIPQTVTRPTEK